MGLAFSSLRIGKKYHLINYGEEFNFTLLKAVGRQDFVLKDNFTLEQYKLSDLVKFGKGPDFEIQEAG